MYPSLVAEEAKLALTEYLPDRLALTDDEARQRPRAMSQVPISLSAANLSGHNAELNQMLRRLATTAH